MPQFTVVLPSDFPYVTLTNSFIVGACAVHTCLVVEPREFSFAIINICIREIDCLKQFFCDITKKNFMLTIENRVIWLSIIWHR